MPLYTKKGDRGETALADGKIAAKSDPRLHACGTVDELDADIGVILAEDCSDELREQLMILQHHLYLVKVDLSSSKDDRIKEEHVEYLEQRIDDAEARVPQLKQFILSGGTRTAALLHQARTVCRRAERWSCVHEDINPFCLQYLNRLSDLLFALARVVNLEGGVEEVRVV